MTPDGYMPSKTLHNYVVSFIAQQCYIYTDAYLYPLKVVVHSRCLITIDIARVD